MSKKTKHTPGPWEIERIYTVIDEIMGSLTILAADGFPVCKTNHSLISRNRTTPEILANARLIAAAPELLEAAKLALIAFDSFSGKDLHGFSCPDQCHYCGSIEALKSAIEKATNQNI
jgi:hypothetical protein